MKNIDISFIYQLPFKKQMIAFGLIFLIAFFMSYSLIISKQQIRLADAKEHELDLKQQIKMVITNEEKTKIEISQFTMLQNLLNEWRNKLLPHQELPNLLNDMLKIGTANNVHFTLFSPNDEIQDGAYVKAPIKVIAVGSYHQIGSFVSQISNMPKIVSIRNFIITNENKADVIGDRLAKQASAENLLTTEMILEIYFLPEK